jgi:ABC-2 type transport system ATP-binding protein
METCGAEPAFAAALQSLGCECGLFGNGRMKVVLPDAVEIRDVYKVAAERGVQIRRMNHRRDSLEDIFLNAMEQSGGTSGRI